MTDEAESGKASGRSTSANPEPESGYRELRTVFVGSYPAALVLQSALAARGLETFITDEMVKTIDPFITGGNALAVRLQAPAEREEAVLAAIEEVHGGPGSLQLEEAAADDDASTPAFGPVATEEGADADPVPEPSLAEAEDLGARVRWASVIGLTGPLGVFYGLRYFQKAGRLSHRPRRHGFTVAAFFLSLVWTGVLLFLLTSAFAL